MQPLRKKLNSVAIYHIYGYSGNYVSKMRLCDDADKTNVNKVSCPNYGVVIRLPV